MNDKTQSTSASFVDYHFAEILHDSLILTMIDNEYRYCCYCCSLDDEQQMNDDVHRSP